MEIKINLNQLFESSHPHQLNTTQQTPSSHPEHSFQTLSDSFDYQLTLDPALFQPPNSLPKCQSLPSDQEHSEHWHIKSQKGSETSKIARPGERLYYESQAMQLRKIKERQKIDEEREAVIRNIPFVPTINKQSRKIAQKSSPVKQLKSNKDLSKTSKQIREEKEFKQCTFQPKLLSKNQKLQKSRQELFYMLHNASKLKELKRQQKQDVQAKRVPHKKMPPQQLKQFLKRNEEYANVARQKMELMQKSAGMYDFRTGEKLFSPRISDFNHHEFISPKSSQVHQQPPSDPRQPKRGIFSKKYQVQEKIQQQQYIPKDQSKPNFRSLELSQEQQFIREEQYNEEYQRYSQEYDRAVALKQPTLSAHQIIIEQSEKQIHDISEHSLREGVEEEDSWHEKEEEVGEQFGQDINMWGSAEVSNVKQYLAGSQEDQHQPRNNAVMDILTNLMSQKQEEDQL